MSKIFSKTVLAVAAVIGLAWPGVAAAATTKMLSGHVPAVVSQLAAAGLLPADTDLHLAIGLPLRNQAELNSLLQQVCDPSSTNYRKFLSTAEFTAQFGPTAQDYQDVVAFATAHGLTVKARHANRMLLEVSGKAADVQQAFGVSLKTYNHPTENRTFFAPDAEPVVPASLPVLDISGLNSYARPHTKLRLPTSGSLASQPHLGSGPFGNYMGNDFRAAYVPGTALNGSGQKVALVQFDGYLASDIALYEQTAGLPSVALTNILLNGFSGNPTGFGGEVEVSLDIEMVISMAPHIDQVMLYEGDPFNFFPNVVLNQIAVDNAAKSVSCSWGWIGGPNATSEQIFLQMAVQGQSFYNASGDNDAFLPGQVDDPGGFGFPSSSPNITQVGGTTLTTTGPGGQWVSEKVWNWGGGTGSSGGVSDAHPIPIWQQGINMTTNHGSLTGRNIPDVALTGDNVFVIADNGIFYVGVGGTSVAAPLWGGFTALVNQQAAGAGRQPVGFINPAIYGIFKSPAYQNDFYDITVGNNFWSLSPSNYPATPGYDLCTGLGTPRGTNLINALANPGGIITGGPIITAPSGPYGSTLGVMNGSNPNGDWFLFVQDDAPLDVGIITNGWMLSLTSANPVGLWSDNQLYVSATNVTITFATNYAVTLAVTNYGPSTSSNVVVSDVLPAFGLSLVSSNHTAGTVSVFGSALSWNVGTLQTNAGATLTLVLHGGLSGSYTNTATVNSLTTDPNPDDDNVATSVIVAAPPAPPVISSPALTGGSNGFRLTVTGDAAYPATVQASTNLLNWTDLYTAFPPFTFTNPIATNYPVRFYRAVVQ